MLFLQDRFLLIKLVYLQFKSAPSVGY